MAGAPAVVLRKKSAPSVRRRPGFAQNFLAVAHPPHLVAQYMVDTGLSLFEEGYRLGGLTNPTRFKVSDAPAKIGPTIGN